MAMGLISVRNQAFTFSWMLAMAAALASCSYAGAQQANFESLPIADQYNIPPVPANADARARIAHRRTYSAQSDAIKAGEDALESSVQSGNFSQAAEDYLNNYLFPLWTQTDPQVFSLASLGEARARFLKDYLDDDITGAGRGQLIQRVITGLQPIMTNKALHPAARLNAVYLIGMLDDQPSDRRNNRLPVPSAQALTTLSNALVANDDDQYPTYIKIAALSGIQRHVELGQAAGSQLASKAQILAEINRLLAEPTDVADATAYWLKRRAMQIGGYIGDNTTVDHMQKTLKSKDEPFWIQVDALQSLAELAAGSNQAPVNGQALEAMTEFVVNGLDREADSIKAKVDDLVYKNILLSDIDLMETGTNFSGNAATGESAGTGGGSSGRDGGKFGGGMSPGGPGGGMGAGGPGGPGSFGGGSGMVTVNPGAKLELPNYELQASRSRIKTIAVFGKKALGDTDQKGLRRFLNEDKAKTLAKQLYSQLNLLQAESSIGIIDLNSRQQDPLVEEEEESFTKQLQDLCRQYSGDINDNLLTFKGEAPGGAQPDGQPAADGSAPASSGPDF